jgi:hypothetical protein
MRIVLEQKVLCPDGPFGELADVVVDPAGPRVTHLVVLPAGRRTGARLVPLDRVDPGSVTAIALRCPRSEVEAMEVVDAVAFLGATEAPAEDPEWDVGVSDVTVLPPSDPLGGVGPVQVDVDAQVMMGYDRVPKGEVEIRRASTVTSADGHFVGHLDGVVVDDDGDIAEIRVAHGHLWARRHVAIPIAAVERIDNDSVALRIALRETR